MTPQQKEELDLLGKLHQMKINTRLTALQSALQLMGTTGYTGIAGQTKAEDGKFPEPAWVRPPGAVDHITLLAIAGDVEDYILGDLEQEAKDAITEAKKPVSNIIKVRP